MEPLEAAEIREGRIDGDHASNGKRSVTLLQAEHLSAIGSFLGRQAVDPADLRRNVVVEGLNLAALKGRRVKVGGSVLEITTICAPCSRMEETFGRGGYAAVRGHGGWCASVVSDGLFALGDPVLPL